MGSTFRFPRLRTLVLRILNRIFPPDAPTVADTEGRINEAREEERRRLSHTPTATPAVADVYVAPMFPTIGHLSPEPPPRATTDAYWQQRATLRHAILTTHRHNTALAQSVAMSHVARRAQLEPIPPTLALPTPPRWMQDVIDERSRETPPQEQPAVPIHEDEDATEEMSAIRKLAKGRF